MQVDALISLNAPRKITSHASIEKRSWTLTQIKIKTNPNSFPVKKRYQTIAWWTEIGSISKFNSQKEQIF